MHKTKVAKWKQTIVDARALEACIRYANFHSDQKPFPKPSILFKYWTFKVLTRNAQATQRTPAFPATFSISVMASGVITWSLR